MKRKLLIVTDGKAGHENQSKAFCAALGYGYECLRVGYPTRFHKGLSYLIDRLGLIITYPFTTATINGSYAAVVSTGSTAFYPAKVVSRRLGIPMAVILYPAGYRKGQAGCILAPGFDRPPSLPNLVTIPVNLTAVTETFYAQRVADFKQRHTQTRPASALILGGPNAHATLRTEDVKRDVERFFAATEGGERWVTTSRRTPAAVEALIATYPFDYMLLFSRDTFNPIPAFVTLCDRLFVTADSTGMISEAVTRGTASVEILMNLTDPDCKFARFIADLEAQHAVHCFDGVTGHAGCKIDLRPAFEKARGLLGL